MPHIIGIDLGTTFSAVAHVDESGRAVILSNRDGKPLTPSVIAFTPAGPVFGEEAKSLQALGGANIASFFKRWMGDAGFYLEFDGRRYDAAALAGLLLGRLKEDAEAALGGEVKKAVITVPAYFNNFQREATVRAGKLAGLDVLRIINEPTAAAIAYGMNKARADQTLLVYDLGGGTFDVTLVESTAGALRVIATDGDHQLGGKDWDDWIMQHVAGQFREEFGINPLADVETMNDLLVACEAAKVTLSQSAAARVRVFCDGERAAYDITREMFEDMTVDLVDRTQTLCQTVVAEAGMDWQRIDGVLLVGGATRMPMIARAVEEISGKQAIYGIDIDEAVAIGAAIQAAIDAENDPSGAKLTARRPAIAGRKTVEDVTSHSLGMIAENADRSQYVNAIILPRNSAIPCRQTRPLTFRTTPGRDLSLDVYLLQGESQSPGECAILGKYVFSGIQDEPGGKAVLEITYFYDQNGIVSVSGVQRSTGKPLVMRVEPVPVDMGWIYGSPTAKGLATGGHVTVIIAVDCSGSMEGKPMREAQNAAREFVRKIDLAHFSVGIMAFADATRMLAEPSQDARQIEAAISALSDCREVGFGNECQPFTDAYDRLIAAAGVKFLIVLTDGIWYNVKHSIEQAARCRNNDIGVVAIGFGDAKAAFLRDIASCDENALFTDVSRLGNSFSTIAQVLTESGGQLRKVFKGVG